MATSPGLTYSLNNPILNAYVTGLQLQRQQQQAQTQKEQFQQNLDFEKQKQQSSQDLLKQQLQDMMDYHKSEIGMHTAQMQSEQFKNQLAAKQYVQQMMNSGAIHPQIAAMSGGPGQPLAQDNSQQNSQPFGQLQQPQQPQYSPINVGGISVDPTEFAGPEEIQNKELAYQQKLSHIKAQGAGEAAGAEASAKQPFEMEQLGAKTKSAAELRAEEDRAALQRAAIQANATQNAAAIRANATRDAARISATMGMNPDDFSSLANGAALGQIKLPTGKQGLLLQQHLLSTGQVPVDPSRTKQLDSLHSVDNMIDLMQQYVTKYAPSNMLGAVKNRISANMPASDLKNLNDMINAQSTIAVRDLGEVSRVAVPEIQMIQKEFANPSSMATRDQLNARLTNLRNIVKSKANEQILGGIPQNQKNIILQQHGYNADFSQIKPGSEPNPGGHSDGDTQNYNGANYKFSTKDNQWHLQ